MHFNNLKQTSIDDNVAWESEDGHVSTSFRESTRRHQDYVFKQFYMDNKISRINDDRMIKWLRKHKKAVLELLQDTKSDVL